MINIWHVCATDDNPCNGMVAVIPEHATAQSRYAHTVLINLAQHRYKLKEDVPSYNIDDYNELGMAGLIERHQKPDLIVIHGIYLPQLWKFYLKNVRGKYKYVVVPHSSMGVEAQKKSRLKKTIANNLVIYKMCREANAVQFLSETEKRIADKRFYKENTIVLGNGIHPQEDTVKEDGWSENIRFTYIGRIDIYHKGLDILLEAIKSIYDVLIENKALVNIYGDGNTEDKAKLQELIAEYKIDKVVTVGPPVFAEDKKRVLLEETSYFIMSSRFEGQPMAALEAMSYGIPLVATENAGLTEDINKYDCGVLCKTTPEAMAKAIEKAVREYSKERMNKMSRGAVECASQYYWEQTAKKTVEEYSWIVR